MFNNSTRYSYFCILSRGDYYDILEKHIMDKKVKRSKELSSADEVMPFLFGMRSVRTFKGQERLHNKL